QASATERLLNLRELASWIGAEGAPGERLERPRRVGLEDERSALVRAHRGRRPNRAPAKDRSEVHERHEITAHRGEVDLVVEERVFARDVGDALCADLTKEQRHRLAT